MRVSYYCQHVLGIGHLKRSLEICRHLATSHETTLIVGGPPASFNENHLKVLQLPGLKMDSEFNNLVPCEPGRTLEQVKNSRQRQLYAHFEEIGPDCFITELYPFGRKAFRFELDPVLQDIRGGILRECQTVCSVRDILVEKTEGRKKWEDRVIKTVNSSFSAILVHADPTVVKLDETFGPIDKIETPMHYTGFVSEPLSDNCGFDPRSELEIAKEAPLILASAGGGNVGSEMLLAVVESFKLLQTRLPDAHLQVFTGPYCTDHIFNELLKSSSSNIHVSRYTQHFTAWLEAANLSVSMAGYNTCMNLLQTGTPALVFPFMQNREQTLRARKLSQREPIKVLDETDLRRDRLCDKMSTQLKCTRGRTTVKLDGAAKSLQIINSLLRDKKGAQSP